MVKCKDSEYRNSCCLKKGKTHLTKELVMVGGFLRNNLSNSKQASIRHSDVRLLMDRHAYLFGLRTVETQCTGTVRIIAPSPNKGKWALGLLDKLEFIFALLFLIFCSHNPPHGLLKTLHDTY